MPRPQRNPAPWPLRAGLWAAVRRLGGLGLAVGVSGCIVMARTAEVYDPQCRTYVKQVVLEAEAIGTIGHCHNDGCAAVLAAMGIVSAASAVVAGSVAIIGNIAYWVERKGQCPLDAAAANPTPAVTERR